MWRDIRASVGGVSGALAWVAWLACLRGWHLKKNTNVILNNV